MIRPPASPEPQEARLRIHGPSNSHRRARSRPREAGGHYGGMALKVPLPDPRKLLRVERYLARQARATHNLGLPVLEHYYLTSWLALKLWRMERFEIEPRGAR